MSTYRVGDAGATVFDADGKPLVRLQPGCVVVEGTLDTARMPDPGRPKRRRDYADKMIHPNSDYDDKGRR
jgi:hypothetical protein